jgi:lipoprotein-anchoring transpeptidase ErfK/SrfK
MMTAAALVGVGVLAAQAEATAPKVKASVTVVDATAKASAPAKTGPGSGSTTTSTTTNADALPANSGSGVRIVYSPSTRRVWLVEDRNVVERTMTVVPGTITAPTGSYTVSAKSPGATGGDGVQVLYVVRFDAGTSTTYGFDAEAGITGLPPAPTGQTGGVRMAQLDAQALYNFSSVGTTVVVV